MSYTQQFYLQKDEVTVQDESYFGDLFQQFCGQRDTHEWFKSFGNCTILGASNLRVTFTPLQASKLLVALSSEVAKFMDSFRSIAKDAHRIYENELEYKADRITLEAYVALSLAYDSFIDVQHECPFFCSLSNEDPLGLLLRYYNVISGFLNEMKDDDILVLHISY